MSSFQFVVLAPATGCGTVERPSLALAASRAGELGVLDVEFGVDSQRLELALSGAAVGLRLSIDLLERLSLPEQQPNNSAQLLILCGDFFQRDKKAMKAGVARAKETGYRVAVEVVDRDEAFIAQDCGADIIIAKGHESSGRVGETTTFVLLQELLGAAKDNRVLNIPVWARGGAGVHTLAAIRAAGADGVVLDSQMYLARDSFVADDVREVLSTLDGSETVLLPGVGGSFYRVLPHPPGIDHESWNSMLERLENVRGVYSAWHSEMSQLLAGDAGTTFLPVGQDGAFAAHLARVGGTVAGILDYLRESLDEHLEQASIVEILGENAPLAVSHGTRFPVVQGAMTRVSDNADFALSVAEGGALPFLALALMRAGEIEPLLKETQEKLGDLPWGVGILGFVPAQLRKEQMQVVEKYKPPFALIAGGRPDQAASLESGGTVSYLHVPSPRLLETFIEMGSRRFVFEGKECGGHVGPRTSFILWELMVELILRSIGPRDDASQYHVLFAGGIHDGLSASMVAALAAPLAKRGVKVGVLVGSAYLFTKEAVKTGAIVRRFQDEAIKCQKTVLLETGPGHAIRCIDSPYKATFDERKKELVEKDRPHDEVRQDLELMNLGRLRVASKGLVRSGSGLEQLS